MRKALCHLSPRLWDVVMAARAKRRHEKEKGTRFELKSPGFHLRRSTYPCAINRRLCSATPQLGICQGIIIAAGEAQARIDGTHAKRLPRTQRSDVAAVVLRVILLFFFSLSNNFYLSSIYNFMCYIFEVVL